MIAGAGIIGIACAHYLNEAGFEVVIFDRAKAGGACSRANCGYICPSHIPPLTEPGAIGLDLNRVPADVCNAWQTATSIAKGQDWVGTSDERENFD